MIILPIESDDHEHDALIVILHDDSLERMTKADPAEIVLRQTGKKLVNPTILICHEKDSPKLTQLLNSGDLYAIVKHLQRGWKFQPERGDHDRGPESLKDQN